MSKKETRSIHDPCPYGNDECPKCAPLKISSRWKLEDKVKSIVSHPLYQYHYTEGHTRPKSCVDADIKEILKASCSFASSEYKRGQQVERQFILNILDGIDLADKESGGGGTKAIRHALRSRIIE